MLALAMSLLGIGVVPAIFGLWVATLLPIVRNTYAGMRGVPAHLVEAAHGMGMRPLQILRRVELPNALFVIFAGIRTALAINVGTAPLAFLIGGGGLGELIFTGIDLNEPGMMLAGAIPTALLAVLVDFVVGQAPVLAGAARRQSAAMSERFRAGSNATWRMSMNEDWHRSHSPRRRCSLASRAGGRPRTIVVGGKNFTEQQIMAEMTASC